MYFEVSDCHCVLINLSVFTGFESVKNCINIVSCLQTALTNNTMIFMAKDKQFVIGIDEAGMGPVFGPLLVAGVLISKESLKKQ